MKAFRKNSAVSPLGTKRLRVSVYPELTPLETVGIARIVGVVTVGGAMTTPQPRLMM